MPDWFTIRKNSISFYNDFNQPLTQDIIDILVANKIKKIQFGREFNQLIDNLPDNIISIYLCYKFDKPITKLPKKLTWISLPNYYELRIDNWPQNLETLYLPSILGKTYDCIPLNIKNLHIGADINLKTKKNILDYLPITVKHLGICTIDFQMLNEHLPAFIEELSVFTIRYDNKIIDKDEWCLPDTLKKNKIIITNQKINQIYEN